MAVVLYRPYSIAISKLYLPLVKVSNSKAPYFMCRSSRFRETIDTGLATRTKQVYLLSVSSYPA